MLHFKTEKGIIRINAHLKKLFFLCILGCRLRIWNPFSAAGIGNPIFFDFLPRFPI